MEEVIPFNVCEHFNKTNKLTDQQIVLLLGFLLFLDVCAFGTFPNKSISLIVIVSYASFMECYNAVRTFDFFIIFLVALPAKCIPFFLVIIIMVS